MWEPALILAGLLLIVALVRLLLVYRGRRQKLADLALRLQMRYYAKDPGYMLDSLDTYHFVQQGHSARAVNIIQGRRGLRQIYAFDYIYEIGSGPNRTLQHRTVILVNQSRTLPSIVALPDREFDGMGRFVAFKSFRTGSEEFDQRFSLYSDHPQQGREMLTDQIRRNFSRCGQTAWETSENSLLMYSDRELSAFEIGCLMWRCCRACDLLEGTQDTKGIFVKPPKGAKQVAT
ncbi:MAG: hypothetical protein JW936_05950 [Sedimentisphaerales bacterium]|nr:hypothetical protein [Sedimentisphaerales bacterium]